MQATVSQENKELPYLDCTVMLPLSAQPIAVPKRASWKFMALEHHRQPPAECSYSLPIHKMRIALQPYLSFEHRVNDGRVSHLTVARGIWLYVPPILCSGCAGKRMQSFSYYLSSQRC